MYHLSKSLLTIYNTIKCIKNKSQFLALTLTPSCFPAFPRDTGKATDPLSVTFSSTINDDHNIPQTLYAMIKIKRDCVQSTWHMVGLQKNVSFSPKNKGHLLFTLQHFHVTILF